MTKALTPSDVAQMWQCSERLVRKMIDRGDLPAFRLGGKLLRIRPEDVETFECQNGASHDCEESSPSPSKTPTVSGDVIDLAPPTRQRRPAAPRLDMRN
ncbi:MAG: helix-turn-helix domain-containing protein [Rhizobiaceae bacterium]|nr:helix-turn-helix domain-containing protein [Rhizobiaceae bacterium]MCV0406867.1 helix-turn-helix domain-containing protein [Rhizobiaceae bacterium]